jgi:hypothetical protein
MRNLEDDQGCGARESLWHSRQSSGRSKNFQIPRHGLGVM